MPSSQKSPENRLRLCCAGPSDDLPVLLETRDYSLDELEGSTSDFALLIARP